MPEFEIIYFVKIKQLSYYYAKSEGFRAKITVAEMNEHNSYIRQVKVAEGKAKLNCFKFKQALDKAVIKLHRNSILPF